MVEYFDELWQSWKDVRANMQLTIPFVLRGTLSLAIIGAGALLIIGFITSGTDLAGMILSVIGVAILGLLLLAVVDAWLGAGTLGLANAVVEGNHANHLTFLLAANSYFLTLLLYGILSGLIGAVASAPSQGFDTAVALGGVQNVLTTVISVLLSMVTFVLSVLVAVTLFFAKAYIIRHGAGPVEAISKSYRLLRDRPGHVFASWGVTLLLYLGFGIFAAMCLLPFVILGFVAQAYLPLILAGIAMLFLLLLVAAVSLLFNLRMLKAVEGPQS